MMGTWVGILLIATYLVGGIIIVMQVTKDDKK